MYKRVPSLAIERTRLCSAVFVDTVVEPIEQTVGRRRPDMIWHGLRHGTKLFLARAQYLFGGAPFGHIPQE